GGVNPRLSCTRLVQSILQITQPLIKVTSTTLLKHLIALCAEFLEVPAHTDRCCRDHLVDRTAPILITLEECVLHSCDRIRLLGYTGFHQCQTFLLLHRLISNCGDEFGTR